MTCIRVLIPSKRLHTRLSFIPLYLSLLCRHSWNNNSNNKDIKGIKIDDVEYKLPQFAGDTSLISDGSPQTLDAIIREFDCWS